MKIRLFKNDLEEGKFGSNKRHAVVTKSKKQTN